MRSVWASALAVAKVILRRRTQETSKDIYIYTYIHIYIYMFSVGTDWSKALSDQCRRQSRVMVSYEVYTW